MYPSNYAGYMAELTKKEKMERKDPLVQLYALDLGENLRNLRKSKGWTQQMLAETMGTEHPRISDIERGLIDARLSDIVNLARIMEVSPTELLDFSKHDPADHPAPPPGGHAQL